MNTHTIAIGDNATFQADNIIVSGIVTKVSRHWITVRNADGSLSLCHVGRFVR